MTIEKLIEALSKYPSHYVVNVDDGIEIAPVMMVENAPEGMEAVVLSL